MGKHRSSRSKAAGRDKSALVHKAAVVPAKTNASSSTWAKPVWLQPNQVLRNDVVFGRGPTICSLEGNLQYRSFVCKYKERYQKALKKDKQHYIAVIYDKVKELDPPGRFLEVEGSGLQVVTDVSRVHEKISQALRDKKNCEPTSFLKLYKKRHEDASKEKERVVAGDVSEDLLDSPRPCKEEVISKNVKSTPMGASSNRHVRKGRKAVWPPPPTEKQTGGEKVKAKDEEGAKPRLQLKTITKVRISMGKTTKQAGESGDRSVVKKPVSDFTRITIRCGDWSAPFGKGGDLVMTEASSDPTTDVVMSSSAEADEVMNDDSIWCGPGVFELLQFPTESSMAEDSNNFLEIDAEEVVPVGAKPPTVDGCVTIEPDLVLPSSNSDGSRTHESEDEIIGGGNSHNNKSVDRLFSGWEEGSGDLLDFSGGFAQVFSSEFETEVASMVSNNDDDKDGTKSVTDQSVFKVPSGIAFMCATSSVFFPGGVPPPPTNYRPDVRGKTLDGPGGVAGPRSLLEELTFKDRVDALEAAKNCLITL